ncbi:MAG: ribonuclease D [Spongiibacteraceae bacterium]
MVLQHIDPPIYIDSNEKLQQFCAQWAQAKVLALDTEFIRTDTFYPIAALIQLADGNGYYLIDPLTIDDFSPFKALLIDEGIIKVLHSCSEDLEVFDRLFGVLPRPLIDTQLAAGLDGLGFSLSYQAMTEALLQVHVPKGETRSNWLQRPLSESQIHYAMLDVVYLLQMYPLLVDSLQQKGRLGWLQQDCDRYVDQFSDNQVISQYYKKISSAWKLSGPQLAILQVITEWREQQARVQNIPRGRVLKDRSCYEIARLQPQSFKTLAAIEDMNGKTLRNHSDTLLTLIQTARDLSKENCPEPLPKPLPPQAGAVLKRLKVHVRQCAERLGVAQELLVKKRDYEALLRSGQNGQAYQLPETLRGWREDLIGNELLALLSRENL